MPLFFPVMNVPKINHGRECLDNQCSNIAVSQRMSEGCSYYFYNYCYYHFYCSTPEHKISKQGYWEHCLSRKALKGPSLWRD